MLSQKYGANLSEQERRIARSGDVDLPRRDSLSTRRARMDGVVKRGVPFEDLPDNEKQPRHVVEDDTYLQAKDVLGGGCCYIIARAAMKRG